MKEKVALTYDDIQLIPKYSEVNSRKDINLYTKLSKNYKLIIPLVASPMDTVCEWEMAYKMLRAGGVGCIHRFMTIDEQVEHVQKVFNKITDVDVELWNQIPNHKRKLMPIMAAIGVSDEDTKRADKLVAAGVNVLLIDVAHGHHKKVLDMIRWCKDNLPKYVDIIAGNIATAEAAIDLEEAGVDGIRAFVGSGSLCSTRIQTGFGVPSIATLEEVVKVAKTPVMADGGARTSGDISKAFAFGASSVMLGSMLAGTDESPGKIIETPNGLYKRYRGSASLETKLVHSQEARNVEGESTRVPYKGGVKYVLNSILDGVRSALSYGGASNLDEYNPDYVQITSAGMIEASPHLLGKK